MHDSPFSLCLFYSFRVYIRIILLANHINLLHCIRAWYLRTIWYIVHEGIRAGRAMTKEPLAILVMEPVVYSPFAPRSFGTIPFQQNARSRLCNGTRRSLNNATGRLDPSPFQKLGECPYIVSSNGTNLKQHVAFFSCRCCSVDLLLRGWDNHPQQWH